MEESILRLMDNALFFLGKYAESIGKEDKLDNDIYFVNAVTIANDIDFEDLAANQMVINQFNSYIKFAYQNL